MGSTPHKLSAGAVVVRETTQGARWLLLRAFTHWDFPKGMVEAGEDALQAAVREVGEETLISNLEFPWGYEYIETTPYSRGKVARYYLARTQDEKVSLPIVPHLGRAEHHEYRWVDNETARRLVSPRLWPVIDWAAAKLSAH